MTQPTEPKPPVRIKLEEPLQMGQRPQYPEGVSAIIDAEDEEPVRGLAPWYVSEPDLLRDSSDWRRHTQRAFSRGGASWSESRATGPGAVWLQDLVMGVGGGLTAEEEAFPINGDGLDCRKDNLRVRKKPKK